MVPVVGVFSGVLILGERPGWNDYAALVLVCASLATVLLPARNRRDLEEIPAEAREKLKFVWVEKVEDALAAALSEDAVSAEAA